MTLSEHLTQNFNATKKGGVASLTSVPYQPESRRYKWVTKKKDVSIISLTERVDYLRGTQEEVVGKAPFKTVLLLRGYLKTDSSITFKNERAILTTTGSTIPPRPFRDGTYNRFKVMRNHRSGRTS